MYYKCHKVDFRFVGLCIDSLVWIKKNEDDKCFQYAVMVALNYEEIKWNPERVSGFHL